MAPVAHDFSTDGGGSFTPTAEEKALSVLSLSLSLSLPLSLSLSLSLSVSLVRARAPRHLDDFQRFLAIFEIFQVIFSVVTPLTRGRDPLNT